MDSSKGIIGNTMEILDSNKGIIRNIRRMWVPTKE